VTGSATVSIAGAPAPNATSGFTPARWPDVAGEAKISCRQITTKVTSIKAASDATPIAA
jgi:hypothetical protein